MTMREEWKEILPALFERASVEILKQFIHGCADDISGRKPPQYESLSSTGWSKKEFHNAVLHSKLFLVDAVMGNFDCPLIGTTFPTLNKSLITAISNCVTVRSSELKELLLATACTTPGTSLVDFDWKLKWVLGSSSLSTLQEPLLSVNLHLATKAADCQLLKLHGDYAKHSSVSFELDSGELDSLISLLENVDSPRREF